MLEEADLFKASHERHLATGAVKAAVIYLLPPLHLETSRYFQLSRGVGAHLDVAFTQPDGGCDLTWMQIRDYSIVVAYAGR